MTFALILTVMTFRGPAVTTLSGFSTLAMCQTAGNAWLAQANAANSDLQPRAICVRVK